MVLLSQVTDPLTLLAPIHGGKKDRLYCVCRLARFEPAHPVVRQCPKLFPPLIPPDIMPSSSYGESVTQTKNGGILKMPVSVTIELVKRGFRKNGGRFRSGQRSGSALSTFGIGSVPSTFLYAPLIISIYYSRH